MPGRSGPHVISGVGFLAQQKYYNIFSVDSGPFIFRPPLKGLPEQPYPPNAFQSWTWSYNRNLIGKDRMLVGDQWTILPPAQIPYELTRNFTWQWSTPLQLYLAPTGRN